MNAVLEALDAMSAAAQLAKVIATGHEIESRRGIVDLTSISYRAGKGSPSTCCMFPQGLPVETRAGIAYALGVRW